MFGQVSDKFPVVCWRRWFTFVFARSHHGIRTGNMSYVNRSQKMWAILASFVIQGKNMSKVVADRTKW